MPLAQVRGARGGGAELGGGARDVPGHLEQVAAHRVETVMPAEPAPDPVQQRQPGCGPLHHRRGRGPVEGHHRVSRPALEQAIQGQDLRPVGRGVAGCLVVHGGDRRLQLVLPGLSLLQRRGDQPRPLGDAAPVPPAALLLGQRDQFPAGAGPGRPPGVGEQHQRQQPGDLWVGRQAGVQPPGQPDGLARQVAAGQLGAAAAGVPLVEQQVKDVQHGRQAPGALVGGRQRERLAGGFQGGLGPADPLGHGRLRNQERGGDLPGGQAGDRAQRERDGRTRA